MDKRVRYGGVLLLITITLTGTAFFAIKKIAQNPCDIPTTWSVGTVDRRFGISKEAVQKYAQEATDKWNKVYEKNPLLSYKEQGGEVVINFIYDERQRTTIQNETLKQSIAEDKSELDDIKQTLDSLKADYQSLGRTIEARTKSYTSHLAEYNGEVGYWNSKGGAPNAEYQRLQRENAELETERTALNRDINRYNALALQIQNYGKSHNEVVDTLNHKIETLNQTALREFEEGTYDPSTKEITIYEYSDNTALQRVLAHELGHSIGLKHVEDENAIMYSVNEGSSLELAEADINELKRICKERTKDDVVEALKLTRDGIFRLAESSLHDTAVQAR